MALFFSLYFFLSFWRYYLGRRIFHYVKTRNIRGETGQVAFDDNGDRMFAEYEVINVRDHQRKKIVGKLLYDSVCEFCRFIRSMHNNLLSFFFTLYQPWPKTNLNTANRKTKT